MIKRMISICLMISILIAFIPSHVCAESKLKEGYVKVAIYNEYPLQINLYEVLVKDDSIYMSVEDIATISGYEINKGDFFSFCKYGGTSTALVVDVCYDGTTYFQNKEKKLSFIKNGNGFYLPLAEMLYLLHTQWAVEDDMLIVQQLQSTIEDFLDEYRKDILMNCVNQTDLLINGESRIAHTFRSSLAAMFNDFNIFDHVSWDICAPNPIIKVQEKENGDKEVSIDTKPKAKSEFLVKQYKEAMLQLAVDDIGFLTEEDQRAISDAVAKSRYQQLTANWKDLTLLSGLPENVAETIEDIQKLQNKKATLLFDSFGDVSSLKDIPTAKLNKFASAIGPILDVTDACIKVAEVCNRSKQWDENLISQISVLTDFDNIGYNTRITDYVKVTAREIVEEKRNPSASAWKEAVQSALDAGATIVMNGTPLGIFFETPNIGMAVAKTNEEVKNSVDAAELSYMIDCLIKIEQVAYNELNRSESGLYGLSLDNYDGELFDEDSLARLRSATMLTLRCNLRNRAFIYYLNLRLNDDPQWEKSTDAQNIREQIRKDYALICELMETERYDKQFLRRDVENPFNVGVTLTSEDMDKRGDVRQRFSTEIFHEGKIPEDNSDAMYEWIVTPTIEADNIFYLADYPGIDYPVNVLSKQANNPNAVIQKGNEYGIIDLNGQLLTEIAYKEIANFGDAYMMIRTVPQYSQEYGQDWDIYWLTKEGEIHANVGNGSLDCAIYYYFDGIRQRTGYTEGDVVQETIPVQQSSVYHLKDMGLIMENLSGKYALERDGNLITDFVYDECGSLSDGLLAVCQNGKWGYVDEKGEVVIPIEYDASWSQYPVFDMKSSRSTENVKDYCYAASDGYVVLRKNQNWELRDTSGKSIIPQGIFESICPVLNGKCWVKQGGKWGVIALKGNDESVQIKTIQEITGVWKIDDDKTMEVAGKSMKNIFGTAYFDYGCEMKISEDGSFSFYIGAGNGGEGTCQLIDNQIDYEIHTYEDGTLNSGSLHPSGNEYLVMDYFGEKIYWKYESVGTSMQTSGQQMDAESILQALGKRYENMGKVYQISISGDYMNANVRADSLDPNISRLICILKVNMATGEVEETNAYTSEVTTYHLW